MQYTGFKLFYKNDRDPRTKVAGFEPSCDRVIVRAGRVRGRRADDAGAGDRGAVSGAGVHPVSVDGQTGETSVNSRHGETVKGRLCAPFAHSFTVHASFALYRFAPRYIPTASGFTSALSQIFRYCASTFPASAVFFWASRLRASPYSDHPLFG